MFFKCFGFGVCSCTFFNPAWLLTETLYEKLEKHTSSREVRYEYKDEM